MGLQVVVSDGARRHDLNLTFRFANSVYLSSDSSKLQDYPLLERWCMMLERCSRSISSEMLRLAAARSLKLAGADMIQRALEASCPSLLSVAVRYVTDT